MCNNNQYYRVRADECKIILSDARDARELEVNFTLVKKIRHALLASVATVPVLHIQSVSGNRVYTDATPIKWQQMEEIMQAGARCLINH